jgi:hypothetical protein
MRRCFLMVWFLVLSLTVLPPVFAAADSPPIPKGFEYMEGTTASGFVVKDKEGNEFVWVPVKGPLQRVDWKNQTVSVADTTEEIPPELSGSIAKHGGFYIGRYEARVYREPIVKSKKDYFWPANWYAAKWACEKMATDYGYNDVISHLPYDAEWDAIMLWLKESGINPDDSKNDGSYLDNKYNYTRGRPLGLGPYSLNKIFDLAGNYREWTMANYGTNYRVVRGGGADGSGVFESVASRHYRDASASEGWMGFRPALVLKD